ncbi:DUF6320 domain-containing protein [Brachybacterium hainanense]|uniref:DUF6320 domain-containing protein n=1 Tax=Brachybacterium hainanense TaxID=1541174 RepID=A0ABV6RAP2_9MICO
MRRCYACGVDIEGAWEHCPLCGGTVTGTSVPSPFPVLPLRYSRRRLYQTLFLASLGVILASFALQLLFDRRPAGIGLGRSLWLGIAAMWLVTLMAVRKRRNVAKSVVYLVVIVGGICAYWDYLAGWDGWSLTYAVPIMCGCSILALVIAVPALRLETGDHVLYSGLTLLLGLVPMVFVVLGWVSDPLASICSTLASVLVLLLQQRVRFADAAHELGKRLHL